MSSILPLQFLTIIGKKIALPLSYNLQDSERKHKPLFLHAPALVEGRTEVLFLIRASTLLVPPTYIYFGTLQYENLIHC